MTMAEEEKKNLIAWKLYIIYLFCLLGALFVAGRLIYIQAIWKPSEKIAPLVTANIRKMTIEPLRGTILTYDGRPLALTVPIYDIHIDCTIKDSTEVWLEEAKGLAEGLAKIVGKRSAAEYYEILRKGRVNGKKYLSLCSKIDKSQYDLINKLPLAKDGKFKGGVITEKTMVRRYPYGTLGRRTIGFVRNSNSTAGNTNVGLEGKFDYVLHGTSGTEYVRQSDNHDLVQVSHRGTSPAVDGYDVHTTLDIDLQDLADMALRAQIDTVNEVEAGCMVIMDVHTGAIRAMVNLVRDSTSRRLEESQNVAIGRLGEPGSVFKTVTLTSVLNDGYVKSLSQKMPTNKGIVKDAKFNWNDWSHLYKFGNQISIIDGFMISSNYVFASLAIQNYKDNPKKYIDNIFMYKLGEAYDLDIDGMGGPYIPTVDKKGKLSNTTLGSMGFGYSTLITPLHTLTFYNAIANKGRMMKPYLVECIEDKGRVIENRGASVLNGSICSRNVADSVTKALCQVTSDGTGRALKNARCTVAGKTGTSFALLENKATGKMEYKDERGRRKYQGTFVGFFPAEDPQYSIISVIYSKPTSKQFQGGGIPARAIRTVVDGMYTRDPYWRKILEKPGK